MKRFRTLAARALGMALCAALALSLLPATARAAAVNPVVSRNINAGEYVNGRRWASTVKSYLYPNAIGGLTRVEYANGKVLVEDYDSQFRVQAGRSLPLELPLWGGFFAGADYNFLVFGQNNEAEDNGTEVIRIVKFSKTWQRLGSVSLYGANTYHPFDGGSLRMAEYNGYLYVRTCHEMYANKDDGLHHQASMIVLVRQSNMQIADSACEVGGPGYVSHSFNQYILIDGQQRVVTLDHGDAYPRSIVLQRLIARAGSSTLRQEKKVPAEQPGWYYTIYEEDADVQKFPSAPVHYNDTGAGVGGFAETTGGYVTAYNYDGVCSNLGAEQRAVYLAFTDKSLSRSSAVRLTNGIDTSIPVLAPTGLEGGYVLWNRRTGANWYSASFSKTLSYARYDAGGRVGQVQTAAIDAPLSDCAPIYWNGKVVWYVTDNSAPTFYFLDGSGVTARAATAGTGTTTPTVPTRTAYANTQTVLLDGRPVIFQTYALRDAKGNATNYIKLRDLAYYLNGTQAQFAVDWQFGLGIFLTSGVPYTPNGSELSTPFSGNRAYKDGTNQTTVNGSARNIASIVLTDNAGGDYTYYQLRDMGRNLGFNVSYISGRVVIDTTQPYSDAQ